MSNFEGALYRLDRARANTEQDAFDDATDNLDKASVAIEDEIQLLRQRTPIGSRFERAENSLENHDKDTAIRAMTDIIGIIQRVQQSESQFRRHDSD